MNFCMIHSGKFLFNWRVDSPKMESDHEWEIVMHLKAGRFDVLLGTGTVFVERLRKITNIFSQNCK